MDTKESVRLQLASQNSPLSSPQGWRLIPNVDVGLKGPKPPEALFWSPQHRGEEDQKYGLNVSVSRKSAWYRYSPMLRNYIYLLGTQQAGAHFHKFLAAILDSLWMLDALFDNDIKSSTIIRGKRKTTQVLDYGTIIDDLLRLGTFGIAKIFSYPTTLQYGK